MLDAQSAPGQSFIMNQVITGLSWMGVALLLGGCWTPPSAHVQPPGPPRIIQQGILVKSVTHDALVESVDTRARTLIIQTTKDPRPRPYETKLKPSDLTHLAPGAKVRATVTDELTIYVARDGRPPGPEIVAAAGGPQAKVLLVDPSYRLLTVQYVDGQTQTFKVGLDVKLQQMQPGDDVLIEPVAIVAVAPLRR
jgi:hypothetical protein